MLALNAPKEAGSHDSHVRRYNDVAACCGGAAISACVAVTMRDVLVLVGRVRSWRKTRTTDNANASCCCLHENGQHPILTALMRDSVTMHAVIDMCATNT